MDRLRPRKRKIPSEFTNSEVQELEYYVTELGEQPLNQKFCAKIADAFSRSVGRAGKSRVTWDEIQRWLQDKHRELMDKAESIPVQPDQHTKLPDGGMNVFALDEACNPVEAHDRCWTTDIPAATLQKTMLNKHIDFTFLLNENTLLPIIIMVDSTQLPIIVLVDGCIPVNSLEQCQAIGVPSSSELNEDSSEPVKVQEQRIAISSQIPSPFQFNGSTHHLDASSNLVVPADESLRIKAHEQSTTQVPSSTQTHIKGCTHLPGVSEPCMTFPAVRIPNGAGDTNKFTKGEKFSDLSEVEFEARSSKDEAWYDVERVLTHRILSSGEAEVRVRYVGYGAEEDEWVNVKNSVRERSLPVEHWECYRVKVGDLVLCFQERDDQAIYFDAHVLDIQRRMHDIRGCRCIFLVRYNHDITEEKVRLRRLCRRP